MFEKLNDYILTLKGILAYVCYLRKSCYRSKEIVEQEQYKKLKRLLLIAQTKVPYYIKLFKKIDFDTERDFRSIDDLKRIPITEKAYVKAHPEEFLNPDYRGKALTFHTSGSTGKPLVVKVSKNQWVIEQGVVWRHWSWAGYKFRDKMAIVRSYAPKDGKLIKDDRVRNFRYYSPFDLSEENMKMYLEDMVVHKVKFLRGYPTSIKPLAQYVLRQHCDIPKLKGILTASEILHDSDREIIEKAFGCKVSNHYGMAECIIMMGDCEKHEGMHNYDEYGYVEYLDTDNPRIKQMIGTNLNNYAMPLLRYETGDLAEMSEKPCSCERSSAVVHNIIGRTSEMMELEDRQVPLVNFFTMMEYYTSISQWQIVQVDKRTVELRMQGYLSEQDMNTIEEDFKNRLPSYVEYSIYTDKPMIQKYEGKIPPFVKL